MTKISSFDSVQSRAIVDLWIFSRKVHHCLRDHGITCVACSMTQQLAQQIPFPVIAALLGVRLYPIRLSWKGLKPAAEP